MVVRLHRHNSLPTPQYSCSRALSIPSSGITIATQQLLPSKTDWWQHSNMTSYVVNEL